MCRKCSKTPRRCKRRQESGKRSSHVKTCHWWNLVKSGETCGTRNRATRRCRVAFANICQTLVRHGLGCLSSLWGPTSDHVFRPCLHICFTFVSHIKFSCVHYISLSLCCLCPLIRYPLISTNIHYPLMLRSAKKITARTRLPFCLNYLGLNAMVISPMFTCPWCKHFSICARYIHFTDLWVIQPVSTVSNPSRSSSTFCSLSSTGCLSRKCSRLGIPEKSSGFGIARHPTFPTTNH